MKEEIIEVADHGPQERVQNCTQGDVEAALRKVVMNPEEVLDTDRKSVLSFLSGAISDGGHFSPPSGEIVGIMKQLKDEMTADLDAIDDLLRLCKEHDEKHSGHSAGIPQTWRTSCWRRFARCRVTAI